MRLFDFQFALMLFRYTMRAEQIAMPTPKFRARQLFKAAGLLLFIVVAFLSGRYLAPPRTVYLIGTPIEPLATVESSAASTPSLETRAMNSTEEIVAVCGAPTRSGKPCQRKVKGGGYCYQHRDKYGQKNAGARSQ